MAAVCSREEGGSHSNLFGILEGRKMTWSDALWMNHIYDIWSIEVLYMRSGGYQRPHSGNYKTTTGTKRKRLSMEELYTFLSTEKQ